MLEKIIPEKYHYRLYRLKKWLFGREHVKSYSQEGEDMVLKRLFEDKKNGFFVDIGAHHPTRFSNTFYFYNKGWSGINIDAMPGSMSAFKKRRKRDINLEIAISKKPQKLTYYSFLEPAINGFDQKLSEQRIKEGNALKEKIDITTHTLEQVFDEYLAEKVISFISIDVEGLDFEILESNNWNKYKPEVVVIECLNKNFEEVNSDPIYGFLVDKGYTLVAKTINTCFFKLKN